MIIRW